MNWLAMMGTRYAVEYVKVKIHHLTINPHTLSLVERSGITRACDVKIIVSIVSTQRSKNRTLK